MTNADALALLELSAPYTEGGLKTAYRQALMVWQPERFTEEGLRARAEEKTQRIHQAYGLLSISLGDAPNSMPGGMPASGPGTAPASAPSSGGNSFVKPRRLDGSVVPPKVSVPQGAGHMETLPEPEPQPARGPATVPLSVGMQSPPLSPGPDRDPSQPPPLPPRTDPSQPPPLLPRSAQDGVAQGAPLSLQPSPAIPRVTVPLPELPPAAPAAPGRPVNGWAWVALGIAAAGFVPGLGAWWWVSCALAALMCAVLAEGRSKRLAGSGKGMALAAFAVALAATAWQISGAVTDYKKAKLLSDYEMAMRELKGDGVPVDAQAAFARLLRTAEKGHREAQRELALLHETGVGTEQNDAEALMWLLAAAEQGDPAAQTLLGGRHASGKGVTQDHSEAVKWYQKAALQEHAPAQVALGLCHAEGHGLIKDAGAAITWWERAAAQGDRVAQWRLSDAYDRGIGTPKDESKATAWCRKAAEQGHADAQFNLGARYLHGIGGVEIDRAEAVLWLRKAAEQGVSGAQYLLADCHEQGIGVAKDMAKAAHWYRQAASGGVAAAMYALAPFYDYGLGGVKVNRAEAFRLYRQAAEGGVKEACLPVALCYLLGRGVTRDQALAKAWYLKSPEPKSAEDLYTLGMKHEESKGSPQSSADALACYHEAALQGHAAAQERIAVGHFFGELGLKTNQPEGMLWFQLAAEKGRLFAQSMLAEGHRTGSGVAKDLALARRWYQTAALHGDHSSKVMLGRMYEEGEDMEKNPVEALVWNHLASDQADLERAANAVRREALEDRYSELAFAADPGDLDRARKRVRELKAQYPQCLGTAAAAGTPPTGMQSQGTPAAADPQLLHLSTDDRLDTGVLVDHLDKARYDGRGKLTLDNGLTEDAYVKIILDRSLVAAFYVRGKTKFTFDHLPDGRYELLYCSGYGWDATRKDFARGRYAVRYDDPLVYTTQQRMEGGTLMTYTDQLTLTLHQVEGGNTSTTPMSVEDFDKY